MAQKCKISEANVHLCAPASKVNPEVHLITIKSAVNHNVHKHDVSDINKLFWNLPHRGKSKILIDLSEFFSSYKVQKY